MIIDLSGYSFSGKSAYYDLLSGCQNIRSFGIESEFDLIRSQGGLLDLYHALCVSWSPIRSSEAIRRFRRLILYFGGQRNLYDRVFRYGPHYDSIIEGFTEKSESFIKRLTLAEWKGEWPFADFNESHSFTIFRKNLKKFGLAKKEIVYLSSFSEAKFMELCVSYIRELFEDSYDSNTQGLLLNNCFEPFDPLMSMRFFPEARAIVVDRDPRDIYISASNARTVNGVDVGGAVIGGGVETFINRFLTYRDNVSGASSPKLMRTNFENLILNNANELEKLSNFLAPLKTNWSSSSSNLNLEKSGKNIRQWMSSDNIKYKNDIKLIEKHLYNYCYI
jgi:hypothetical protein